MVLAGNWNGSRIGKLFWIIIIIVYFTFCKNCCGIMKLQESIIKQNPDLDWNQVVTWHQWKNYSMGRLRIVRTISKRSQREFWTK